MLQEPLRTKTGRTILELVHGDISNQDTIAIVNAANKALEPGGGVAGAIHSVAGPALYEECKKVAPCETGEAKITSAFDLPNEYVIHTVGPIYKGGPADAQLLTRCYKNSLKLAEEKGIESIAFPAISTGIFGYPTKEAADVALTVLKEYLKKGSMLRLVRIVIFELRSFVIHKKAFKRIFRVS